MTDAADTNIHHQLGAILAEVQNLKQEFRRSEDKSDASRAAVHRRMDDLVTELGGLKITVAATKEDVAEMKPITDDVRRWKLMGIGALGMIGLGGLALGVSLQGALSSLLHVIKSGP